MIKKLLSLALLPVALAQNAQVPAGRKRLAPMISVTTNAKKPAAATACACYAFEDANGPVTLTELVGAPLVDGTRISDGFGMRLHPILGCYAMHWGVDIGAKFASPVYASSDGVVVEAGNNGDLGNYVRVRHSRTVATGYAHASGFGPGIHPGVYVRRGQILAYVGATGLSTGPHLHYEVFVKGLRIEAMCACVPPAPKVRPLTARTIQPPPSRRRSAEHYNER